MKKAIYSSFIFLFIIITIIIFYNPLGSQNNYKGSFNSLNYPGKSSLSNLPIEIKPVPSQNLERYYFERWHEPYGAVLPKSEMTRIWNEINTLPEENDFGRVVLAGEASAHLD